LQRQPAIGQAVPTRIAQNYFSDFSRNSRGCPGGGVQRLRLLILLQIPIWPSILSIQKRRGKFFFLSARSCVLCGQKS
jgi:hypothetical protein